MFVNSALSIDNMQQWVAAQLSIFFTFEFLNWKSFLSKHKIITQFALKAKKENIIKKLELQAP